MIYNLGDIKGSLNFAPEADEKVKGNDLSVAFAKDGTFKDGGEYHLTLKLYETRNNDIKMEYYYTTSDANGYGLYVNKKRTFNNKAPDRYIGHINDADLQAIFDVLADFDQLLIAYKSKLQ